MSSGDVDSIVFTASLTCCMKLQDVNLTATQNFSTERGQFDGERVAEYGCRLYSFHGKRVVSSNSALSSVVDCTVYMADVLLVLSMVQTI